MENIQNQPTQQNQRLLIVDTLRGWALLGVVIMNYFDFFSLEKNWATFKSDKLTDIIFYITGYFFAAKSWTLLSLLFGYGFAVLMNNVKEKGHNAYSFFAGRMFWLLVIAFINSAIFFGDILKDYAFLGLLLLPFYRASAKTMFIISLILLLSIPALDSYINSLHISGWKDLPNLFYLYKSHNLIDVLHFGLIATYVAEMVSGPYLYTVHVIMFCCMLWGFCLYKINFFKSLADRKKYIVITFWISLITAIILLVYLENAKKLGINIASFYRLEYWGVLSSMLSIASAICWLYISNIGKTFFTHLSYMGKMTLTNYMTQNLIGLFIFSGFGLGILSSKPIWFYITTAIVIYIAQVFLSKWWLTRYNYGPVEWIWRQLSYRKRLPLKKQI